ncbi:MAG: type transport system ATP-binding protein, partial [Thermoplasmata archaeon]|nr:type transport system ATP-binding protein [Thermoplasmata archaeon]
MASPARPVSAARPAPSNGRPGSDAVIEVRDLVKQYKDGTQAVKGISFSVRKGEIFGFLGPNGAGKTTTMRIL